MTLIWYNQGYSSVRDALVMIREEAQGRVRLMASHRDPHAPALHFADIALSEPYFKRSTPQGQADHLAWCLEICKSHGVELFVAQGARAQLASHIDDFAAIGTRLIVPADGNMLELIDDKARFYEKALEAGLPMPWTRQIDSVEGYDAALAHLDALGLAACVKPPKGVFGGGFWKLKRGLRLFDTVMNAEGHEIAPEVMRDAVESAPGKRLLVLEYLAGDEWSVDCVCKDGELITAVARRKLGRAQRLEIEGVSVDIARHAVRSFNLSGLINIQCKAANRDGTDIRLLEINTRMSGGCLYTRYAGVKLPWIQVALELGLISEDDLPTPKGGALVSPLAEAYAIEMAPEDQALERELIDA